MSKSIKLEKVIVPIRSINLLKRFINENPEFEKIFVNSKSPEEAKKGIKNRVLPVLKSDKKAYNFYKENKKVNVSLSEIEWSKIAAIRILDYIDHSGKVFEDPNFKGLKIENDPFKLVWLAIHKGTGGSRPDFFEDMIHLLRQYNGKSKRTIPTKDEIDNWMDRHPSGLEPRVIKLRQQNKQRILNIIINKIDNGEIRDSKYFFKGNLDREQKFDVALKWWKDKTFHLRFAVRSPELLDELLDNSLDPITMKVLYEAKRKGIPFFINLYYLSLLNVNAPWFAVGAELAIRDYVFYSKELVNNYGKIIAWEKEDIVEPGKPNAAGWILPSYHSVHRRYPEVAILIPDTMGRACGGLCSSCQRMYNFQNGLYNFNLDKLKPNEKWEERLDRYLEYFENDSQLRDILITGGDAFMSSDKSLCKILDAVYEMSIRKIEANKHRSENNKYAQMLRVRLGTRIPVYLPQRITHNLIKILTEFKEKASKIGIKQFVVQTHFVSPMEVTPEVKKAVNKILSSGWIVTNQHVFITAASRRGHAAKLRKIMNDIGIVPYYTFCVKGYKENVYNFSTNARLIQEQTEEKYIGNVPDKYYNDIKDLSLDANNMVDNINNIRNKLNLPFIATDRNILNMPGVGKSLSFRTIGITRRGRRILEFDHDNCREHSPVVDKMGKVLIVESKSINDYLQQLEKMGEDPSDYKSIWGYSIGESEKRHSLYEYPEFDFTITKEYTNIMIDK